MHRPTGLVPLLRIENTSATTDYGSLQQGVAGLPSSLFSREHLTSHPRTKYPYPNIDIILLNSLPSTLSLEPS